MNKEIEIKDPEKILPWIGGPYMAAGILIGVILLIGFTPDLLFVNYFFEALFLFLFFSHTKTNIKRQNRAQLENHRILLDRTCHSRLFYPQRRRCNPR